MFISDKLLQQHFDNERQALKKMPEDTNARRQTRKAKRAIGDATGSWLLLYMKLCETIETLCILIYFCPLEHLCGTCGRGCPGAMPDIESALRTGWRLMRSGVRDGFHFTFETFLSKKVSQPRLGAGFFFDGNPGKARSPHAGYSIDG